MTDEQKVYLRLQTDLQDELQSNGFNLVDCGNCGFTFLYRTHVINLETASMSYKDKRRREYVTCPCCLETQATYDCPDHFYPGFEQSAEFDNLHEG